MALLLDLGYLVLYTLTLPWRLVRRGGRGSEAPWRARLGFDRVPPCTGAVWLHGSSMGEIALLKPLIERFERELPAVPLLISAYTATGYAAACRAYPTHRVVHFPSDLSFAVRRVLRRHAPRLIVIVEAELWPNFLRAAQRAAIPVAVINGRMSAKSFRFHARTHVVPGLLRRLPLLAVQTEEHAGRLRALGVAAERVHVTGNMKYDLARRGGGPERANLREGLGYDADDVVWIGGSLHAGEDEALLDAYAGLRGRFPLALIVVPRYPAEAQRAVDLAAERGLVARLKTELRGPVPPGDVLVVDTVGELNGLYAAADLAFVGGSLFYRGSNKGGHNLMEPAVLGVPVLFGPYNFSFKEIAADLLAAGGGLLVRDGSELEAAAAGLLSDPERRRRIGAAARDVVEAGRGATARNFTLLRALLRPAPGGTHNLPITGQASAR